MQPSLNKGKLIKWNDDRGFGFIKPCEGGKEVFLHISAIKTSGRRPQVGDTIFYQMTTGTDGRVQASGALIQGVISYSSTAQKKTTSVEQKIKSHKLSETIIAVGILVLILLFHARFNPRRTPIKQGCNIKGNISIDSGAKLYHVPGMEDYDGTNIDLEKGEQWFCSESEAQAAGWSRAPR